MRAALGLALIFGGSLLALYVLSGRVPFSGNPGGAAAATGSGPQVQSGPASGGGMP